MRKFYFQKNRGEGNFPVRDENLVRMILQKAREIVSHPTRPRKTTYESFVQNPHGELDIEESLETSPFLKEPSDLRVEHFEERQATFLTLLDCSSSMVGEKHLLASIAIAVLFLNNDPEKLGLTLFASSHNHIKELGTEVTPAEILLKFLKTNPRGFTNIHLGLKEGLRQLRAHTNQNIALIATDGKTTEGEDPFEIAKEYDFLLVLHLSGPGSDREASKKLAQAGNGLCVEVEKFEELPRRMYDAVRMLNRMA